MLQDSLSGIRFHFYRRYLDMKKNYIDLPEAYKFVTPGVPVLIGTKGKNPGQYNLAPIAWNCPLDYEPVTKVLFVSDPAHQTALNAKREGRFAFCIPLSDSVPGHADRPIKLTELNPAKVPITTAALNPASSGLNTIFNSLTIF